MKVSKLFMGMLTALALSACSDDVNVPDAPEIGGSSENQFMAVEITTTPSIGNTRANTKNDNENEENYENGTETGENEVKSLRFYFFKSNGDAANVSVSGKNYVEVTPGTGETPGTGAPEGWPNVEKKLTEVIVLSSKTGDNVKELHSMIAVANYAGAGLGSDSKSLSDLQAIIENYSYGVNRSTDAPFIMTSSVYGKNPQADAYGCEAEVKSENLCESSEAALKAPVKIYIERVLAKVRVNAAWETGATTKKLSFTYTDADGSAHTGIYEAVQLKRKAENGGASYMSNGKPLYAIFLNWQVTGTAKKSHLFKNVSGYKAWSLDFANWHWNNAEWFRSYWALNPEWNWTTTQPLSEYYLDYCSLKEIQGTIGNNEYASATDTKAKTGSNQYCQENAGDLNQNGAKKDYSGTSTLSNRTQVIFKAVLVTEKSEGVAEEALLGEFGGQVYAVDELKTAFLQRLAPIYKVNKSVTEDEDKTITESDYKQIEESDVIFYTEKVTDASTGLIQQGGRYIGRLKLTDAAIEANNFYSDKKGESKLEIDDVQAMLKDLEAKVYPSGLTYYYHDIEHLGDNDLTGKYGVVRNHIYQVNLTQVYGLGTPVYIPEEGDDKDEDPIIPEKPKDDDTFVAAKIHILSWRVVNNNAELDWD